MHRDNKGRFSRKTYFRLLLAGVLVIGFAWAWLDGQNTVHAEAAENIVVVHKEALVEAPVMERIADCESGKRVNGKGVEGTASQFDANGQVLMRPNANGTVDVGFYQVNTVWFKQAHDIGADVTSLEGNRKIAMWIYENRGTGDWSSSVNCWQK